MRTRTTVITLAALLLPLTGCSSSGNTKLAAADRAKSAAAAVAAAASATPTHSPTPTPYALGDTWAWQQTDGTISGTTSVLAYQQPIHSVGSAVEEAGASGYVWAALEVEVCNDDASTGPIDTSDSDWTLAYDDGGSVESTSTGYDDFPRPQFPMGDATVKAGRCLRGKIVYPVPGKQRPEWVEYAPTGLSDPVEWEVPAK